jgi:hypothetical protein
MIYKLFKTWFSKYWFSYKTCIIINWTTVVLELELEFFLRPTVSGPVRLGIGPPFGILDQILYCSSFVWQLRRFAINASSLTRKRVCNLLYNCFWALSEQSHLSRSPTELTAYLTVSSETPPTWRARFPYLYPPGTGWPSYTPGHWVTPPGCTVVFLSDLVYEETMKPEIYFEFYWVIFVGRLSFSKYIFWYLNCICIANYEAVPVLNLLSTTPWRHGCIEEWMRRPRFSWPQH